MLTKHTVLFTYCKNTLVWSKSTYNLLIAHFNKPKILIAIRIPYKPNVFQMSQ